MICGAEECMRVMDKKENLIRNGTWMRECEGSLWSWDLGFGFV
jgi:hypothetical protein